MYCGRTTNEILSLQDEIDESIRGNHRFHVTENRFKKSKSSLNRDHSFEECAEGSDDELSRNLIRMDENHCSDSATESEFATYWPTRISRNRVRCAKLNVACVLNNCLYLCQFVSEYSQTVRRVCFVGI